MPRPGGIRLRKGILLVGVVLFAVGVAVFFIAAVAVGQASADFLNCLGGYPTYPMFGVPSACTNAMSAVFTYQALEGVGAVLGLVGFIFLVIGIALQPERPAPASMPYYPPPVYGPPPGYMPPQGPQSPPPPP